MVWFPVKSMIEIIKTQGPVVIKWVHDYWKSASKIIGAAGSAGKTIQWYRKYKNKQLGTLKNQYEYYEKQVLGHFSGCTRKDLYQYILEIEKTIQQIEQEQQSNMFLLKPFYGQEIRKWNAIFAQITDKMSVKDYQEYLLMYNNPDYENGYFKGFDALTGKFKSIAASGDMEALYRFISEKTGMPMEKIKSDFS
ncbi:hypothetical protein BpJC7_19840 [Weizmannia acidilactici]|uniref:Uncharacterized protein n=1 Tax=Weizmannia acidilactici TaxID=2607726 RepID=A0A5J4JG68_9BACI|nr:hypothetical protein [Weizmannia acidilactici]GER68604.1 hypothetical protein BpJC4_30750 [Weizmannia acidilactici]GER70681.1 hypothetical protein BpJC7_19840 [Weizmannia acidilactici]GER74173.1 hypothetical protein BpPP18_22400 [Weizmannia acidilactici]